MTIGDVLAAIAAVCGVGATWAATVLLTALAFPARAERAQGALLLSPGACLGRGAGAALLGTLAVLVLNHSPLGKLLSVLVVACLAALAALGSAGIVRLLGERIQTTGTSLSPFAALTRGTALYVVAGFLPVVGWFLIVPLALLLSVGSGVAACRRAPIAVASRPHAVLESAEARA